MPKDKRQPWYSLLETPCLTTDQRALLLLSGLGTPTLSPAGFKFRYASVDR